jgi:hypothetical protein
MQAAGISIYFSENLEVSEVDGTLLANSFTAATKAINFEPSFSISLESAQVLIPSFSKFGELFSGQCNPIFPFRFFIFNPYNKALWLFDSFKYRSSLKTSP